MSCYERIPCILENNFKTDNSASKNEISGNNYTILLSQTIGMLKNRKFTLSIVLDHVLILSGYPEP